MLFSKKETTGAANYWNNRPKKLRSTSRVTIYDDVDHYALMTVSMTSIQIKIPLKKYLSMLKLFINTNYRVSNLKSVNKRLI